ncbi:hypothetical protein JCGZ_18854 [Jatropha curcas]|uniref:Uncharacterized protein n=1 Tax=Jatropha curcas TaxID=180498 RepID=A0A067K7J7_JATCU|nr:hypothetical protein JCGZ_18854 [Jatropha curcas]
MVEINADTFLNRSKKHRFPPGYGSKQKLHTVSANNVINTVDFSSTSRDNGYSVNFANQEALSLSTNVALTLEQYSHLLNLLQTIRVESPGLTNLVVAPNFPTVDLTKSVTNKHSITNLVSSAALENISDNHYQTER